MFDDVKKITTGNAYEVIGYGFNIVFLRDLIGVSRPGFYVTFWQLSTYDLSPPSSKYDEEGAALRTLSRQEDSKYITADRSATGGIWVVYNARLTRVREGQPWGLVAISIRS